MTEKTGGKVIPFQQNASFYLKRGAKSMERNNLLEALHRYRLAYEAAPDQADTVLALAETLSGMQRFEESNRLLLILLSRGEDLPECHFGLACNYFGMREYDYAVESLERYLELDPDGPYALDAEDFLDLLDDDDAMFETVGLRDDADYDANAACVYAKHLMDAGDYQSAVSVLKHECQHEPDSVALLNQLALAHLCCGERAKAAAVTERMLGSGRANLLTRCNQALILCAQGDRDGAGRVVDEIMPACAESPDTLNNVCVLLMELERWADAEAALAKLRTQLPYDENVLHRQGYCRYRMRDYAGAQECYKRLLRINPSDTVAAYYFKQSKKTDAEPRAVRAHWTVPYQVPFGEVFRRLNQISKYLSLPEESLETAWQTDRHFIDLLAWALSLSDERVKKSALSFIGMHTDERAERMLRDFLLRTDQPDYLKRAVFGRLKEMGAKEPYMAYLDGRWLHGRVNLLSFFGKVPPSYEAVIQLLVRCMTAYRTEESMTAAAGIFRRYLNAMAGKLPRISEMQEVSMAAALEYLGCLQCGEQIDLEELCARYRVTQTRLRNAVEKLAPYGKDGGPA